ncbi:MAG: dethiobiotin synthase [Candidatus Margulisiibacteriota bacterium]
MLFNDISPKKYFITATDTGAGKTFITVELGKHFQSLGYKTGAMKPFSSGGRQDPEILKKLMEQGDELDLINPVWFEQPMAPYACLLEEGSGVRCQVSEKINPARMLKKIKTAYEELSSKYDILLVEGIGGALVPLWENYYVADLIKEMELPALIVARAGLGTLNHTFMTIEALKKRNINIAGIILNGFSGKEYAERTNRRVIEELSKIPVIAEVPFH